MSDSTAFWTVLLCMDLGVARQSILEELEDDVKAHAVSPQDDLVAVAGHSSPDLLLFSSPLGANLALLRSVRAAHPRLPAVVLALGGTLGTPGFLEKLGDLGVTRFIELPIEPADLARRVKAMLASRHESASPRRFFRAGEVLFLENDIARECFVINSGRVALGKPLGRHTLHTTGEAGPGEVIGEMALLSAGRRPSTAIAAEDTVATVLNSGNFGDVMGSRPAFALQLLDLFVRRHAEARGRLDPSAAMQDDDWLHREASHFSGRAGARGDLPRDTYGPGQVLLEPGVPLDTLYWILEGQVQVQSMPAGSLGAPVTTLLGPDSPMGEVAFLTGELLDIGAVTTEETTLVRIPRERFAAAVAARPAICLELLRGIAARVRALHETLGVREVLELA